MCTLVDSPSLVVICNISYQTSVYVHRNKSLTLMLSMFVEILEFEKVIHLNLPFPA